MQTKQENPNKARLQELTRQVNEETWMCIDKYLCAGFAMLSKNLGKVSGKEFIPTCNENGSLLLGADYLQLFKNTVDAYRPYYKNVISKLNMLKDAQFLDNPAQKPNFDISAFKWLAEQEYTDANVKKGFENYYRAAEIISNIDITKLTKMQNKNFLNELEKAVNNIPDINSFKKITKAEFTNAPEDVPNGIIFEESAEDTEESAVPTQATQSVAKLSKMIASLMKEPADVQNKFKQIEAAKIEMNKVVAKYLQQENNENFKKAANFIKNMKGQVIPALWCLSTLTNLKGDVAGVFEAYSRDVFFTLLTEHTRSVLKNGIAKAQINENVANDEQKNDNKKQIEQASALADNVMNLLKIEKSSVFINKYNEWVKAIHNLAEKLSTNETLKDGLEKIKNADPLEQILGICSLLKNMSEEQPKNGDNNTSKPVPNEDTSEFNGDESLIHSFMKRLDERMK